jgi:hypothetical protein
MKLGSAARLSVIAEMVRKYRRQIVPPADTESLLVPLARLDEFPRLSEQLSLTLGE